MRFLMQACALLFALGLLSLALGTLNEVLDLGIWNDDYPVLGERGDSVETVPGDFGEFALQFGIITVAAGVIGGGLFVLLGGDEEGK